VFRRTLLRTTAAALALGLAGCQGGGDSSGTGADTPTATTRPTPTGRPDAGDTDTPTPASTETSTATDAATGTPTPGPTPASTETPTATDAATGTPTTTPAEVARTVEVGPDGDQFAFVPDSFEVSTGDTVAWVWRSGGHNVRVESEPGGSGWTGTPGDSDDTYDAGYTHSHTFATAGDYEYYCAPHRSLGMTGSFTVTE